jgi:hypothetical protein
MGRGAALAGGLVFMLSGFNLLHYMHLNAVAVVAHLPWMLWAVDLMLRPQGRHQAGLGAAALGLAVASQALLGSFQFVWICALAAGLYALFLAAALRAWGRLWLVAVAGVLGIMAGAVQVLPTAETLALSERAAPAADFLAYGSLHPLDLAQVVSPWVYRDRVFGDIPHESGLYNGAVAAVVFPALWLRRKRLPHLSLAAAAAVLGALGLVLALGAHGMIYRVLAWLPVVGLFRMPARYLALFHFASAVAAAALLADLSRGEPEERDRTRGTAWLALVPVLSLVVTVAILLSPVWHPGSALAGRTGPWDRALAGPLLTAAAAGLVWAASRGSRRALVGLVLFTAADQGLYGLSYVWKGGASTIQDFAAALPTPPGDNALRIQCRHQSYDSNPLVMRGFRLADGYAGLPPRTALETWRPARLRLAAVGWVQAGPIQQTEWIPVRLRPFARVRLVARAQVSADPNADLDRVDLERTALVGEPLSAPDSEPGRAWVTADRPGEITVETEAPASQLLLTTESYHPGWKARCAGVLLPVIRANGDFLACVVPAGRCRVVMRFEPASLAIGAWGSAFGLATLAALALWLSMRRVSRRAATAAIPCR